MDSTALTLALVLGAILVVPLVCERIRIPSIIGFILAGMVLGPNMLGWLQETKTVHILGYLGMLYILFQSGVELDRNDFRQYRRSAIWFGLLTFALPTVLGLGVAHYVLGLNWWPSLLIAAMLGSHTLMTYPIAARYGIQRNRAVNVAVGGSMIAITLALLMLVVVESLQPQMAPKEHSGWLTVVREVLLLGTFIGVTMWGIPKVAQELLKRRISTESQFVMVMLMVVVSAILAEAAGMNAILGAFLCGLTLNTKIPNRSPLMERINFAGGTIFVPVFLLGVGMMIDVAACWSGLWVWVLAMTMIVTKLVGKWLASRYIQWSKDWTKDERRMLFGLTHSAAAGTLAIATIGYHSGILDGSMMDATILMILVLCMTASVVTEQAARPISLAEQAWLESDRVEDRWQLVKVEKFKVEKLNAEKLKDSNYSELRELAALSQLPDPVYITARDWKDALQHIEHSWESTIVYHERQPLSTISRILVAVPRHAEKEHDFISCFGQIRRLSSEIGAKVVFYCTEETEQALQAFCRRPGKYLRARYERLDDFQNILMVQKAAKDDDLIVILQARKNTTSYDSVFRLLPNMLGKFFDKNSWIVLYPEQG